MFYDIADCKAAVIVNAENASCQREADVEEVKPNSSARSFTGQRCLRT